MEEVRAITVHSQSNIEMSGFLLTPLGLIINGEPSFREWELCGRQLAVVEKAIHWALGDWLNYGEWRWGEMYAQALRETDFEYSTLSTDKWIAGRIEFCRRRQNLSFEHHREVAALEPTDQDYWLDRALEGDGDGKPWSKSRLRNEIRAWQREKKLVEHLPESVTVDEAIIWGDCTELIWPTEIDLIVADPPFGLTADGTAGVREGKGDWDAKQYAALHVFNETWLGLAANALKDRGSILVFGTVHNIFSVGHILKELGCYIVRDIVWSKPFVQRQVNLYSLVPSHELIVWARKGERHTCNLAEITRDVWEIQPESKYGHPTEKPEALIRRLILMASDPGDLVFDPFLGSGTTTACAKELKRRYGGIEQDERWWKIATERTRTKGVR